MEYLLKYGVKQVRVLDNYSNGFRKNMRLFEGNSGSGNHGRRHPRPGRCAAMPAQGSDVVLHQAALGSVPRSIKDPITSNDVNVGGFVNMLMAAKELGVKRFVYAASSSTYGDRPSLPKVEDRIGKPLSPYAVTKYANELYADVFGKTYGMEIIGLRYFNIFGPRQDPNGAYAAVIPLFIDAMLQGTSRPRMNGDGGQTRDFTFVENCVQANIRAALTAKSGSPEPGVQHRRGRPYFADEMYNILREEAGSDIDAQVRPRPGRRHPRFAGRYHQSQNPARLRPDSAHSRRPAPAPWSGSKPTRSLLKET